jgi:phosphoserine phosphatase RsbU/P
MGRQTTTAARAPHFVVRHILLAVVFAVAVFIQIGTTTAVLRRVPAELPAFATANGTAVLNFVDSKASAAGLRKGDILVAINGRPFTGSIVYFDALLNAVPGKTLAVTVRAPGAKARERTILLPITPSRTWMDSKAVLISVGVLMPIFCIAIGFWVVLVRPGDPSAWLLLGLLLAFSQGLLSLIGVEVWGPGLIRFTGGYWMLMRLAWPLFMFLFGYYFPEPMPVFRRTPWKWLPVIVAAPYILVGAVIGTTFVVGLTNYSLVQPLSPYLPHVELVANLYIYFLVSGFFFFIFSKSYRDISADSRRRLRLLSWGATVAMTPALLLVIAGWLRGNWEFADWLNSIVLVLFALFPLTLAYVIVVQRAMDVRVVVRQGLRYALAKNGVRVLQALAVLLVTLTGLALVEKNQERPQKILVIVIGLIAIFTIRRLSEKTGAWLDRRFFREAYDAEQVLSELSDSVRSMVEVRSLIETVAERIAGTLHISRVAVLLGGSGPYRPAYALGYGAAPDVAFPAGAGTVKVLERQREPARVYLDDPQSWLYREPEVTEEDRSKLTQLDTELLLPLSTREKLLGFISLGPKLSDEPYSRADLRLLKSVAAQTGLALENAR